MSRPAARFSDEDTRFMRVAMALAEKARGQTHPNPIVGALLVRNGKVLGRGHHRRAGAPHAEIEALADLGALSARGATLYVTLEPCCHTGRTGPCTTPIIAAGISRVVVGCRDLNPLVSGKGIATLRRAGIQVEVGCLEGECQRQNRAFFRWVSAGVPWVTLKVAATLDGFIAPPRQRRGQIHWITGAPARAAAHQLRAEHDAVLVGAGTIEADDPRLTARAVKTARPPLRVVLDGRLRTPPWSRLLRTAGGTPIIMGGRGRAGDPAMASRVLRLQKAGAEVLLLPADRDGRLSLPAVLKALAARGVQSLLVEGGSQVLGAFIAARAVDGVAWFLAPRLAGAGVPVVQGKGLDWRFPIALGAPTVRVVGDDILLTAEVAASGGRRRERARR